MIHFEDIYYILKTLLVFSFSFFTFHLSNAQQLETLINEALTNNPNIQTFELKYRVAEEKTNEAATLPNTHIGAGYFVSEPETRTGAQRFKVSARQMLPWFGQITARTNYLSSLADAKYEDVVIAKRKLVVSVSQSYYNLFALKEKQSVLNENVALLKTYEDMALTSVEAGNTTVVDVLRLQIRQNEIQRLKQILEQDYLAELTRFNKLLNRDQNIEVFLADQLFIPIESRPVFSENMTLHPELLKYDKLYASVEQSELLNQKESRPMLGIGLDYIAVSERPNMDFTDNGKDIIMPMVNLSIPIFNKKFRSATKQNKWKQQQISAEKQSRLNTLESMLETAVKGRKAARISYEMQSKNLQQAQKAEEILMKNYEAGSLDFKEILEIQEMQLKIHLKKIEAVKNFFEHTARINYLSQ